MCVFGKCPSFFIMTLIQSRTRQIVKIIIAVPIVSVINIFLIFVDAKIQVSPNRTFLFANNSVFFLFDTRIFNNINGLIQCIKN